ncbi:unnamed protein product [Timema podura]|uniref:G-protein coupled receptors family 2 profile 1 domain-containing protein n=1 Tax=Timema podura TaxID=61482 RepID=A0ABN7NQN8_TIMPD|nr:unnamed protein product [Timema podura]
MARDDDDVLNPHMSQYACAKWYAEFYTRPDDVYCAAVWDTVLCWPPTLAGATVSQRCPRNKGIDYTNNAHVYINSVYNEML